MDYLLESKYAMFVLDCYREQQEMKSYIEECILLTEGKNAKKTIQRLGVLNEDVGDKVREGWDKFVNFIKRIWAKFVENMTKVFNTDVGYLEKYKDIILGKKMKPVTITMREYNVGLQRISAHPVPAFTTGLLSKINVNDDKDIRFKKSIISDYDGKTEFVDFCKVYFQGGEEEKEFNEHSINMTDLYNFCKDKTKIYGNIEKDQKTLLNSTAQAQKELLARQKELQANTAKPAATPNEPKTESFIYNKAYSAVYESYISEMEIRDPGGNSVKTPTNTTSSQNNATSTVNANTKQNIDKASDNENSSTRDANLKNLEKKNLESGIHAYQTDCTTVLTAKMTAVTAIYNDYMKIIKKHVGDYVGTDNSNDNTVAKAGTDYSTRLKPVDDNTKATIIELIKKADAENDTVAKTDLQKNALVAIKKFEPNFNGSFQDLKTYVGYTAENK